jgi:hypothetical protein
MSGETLALTLYLEQLPQQVAVAVVLMHNLELLLEMEFLAVQVVAVVTA